MLGVGECGWNVFRNSLSYSWKLFWKSKIMSKFFSVKKELIWISFVIISWGTFFCAFLNFMHGVTFFLRRRKTLKGQKSLKVVWMKKLKQTMNLKDSKVKMIISTNKHEGWKQKKSEENTAPGNICGTNWKMGEISTYLWNPQACPIRSTPTHWSLNHTGPAALPQRIILNIK